MVGISSRTPEGRDGRCPACRRAIRLDPSLPPGDATCPFCGALVWFEPVRIGARVRVVRGPFENFNGVVTSFDSQTWVATVEVLIFGRATPVQLPPTDFEILK